MSHQEFQLFAGSCLLVSSLMALVLSIWNIVRRKVAIRFDWLEQDSSPLYFTLLIFFFLTGSVVGIFVGCILLLESLTNVDIASVTNPWIKGFSLYGFTAIMMHLCYHTHMLIQDGSKSVFGKFWKGKKPNK